MRMKSRKDTNQTAVVKELRKRGYDVDVVERPFDIIVSGFKAVTIGYYTDEDNCLPEEREWVTAYIEVSLRVELKSEKGKLSLSQLEYIENLKYPDSYLVATSSAEDPMPAVKKIVDWFGG